MNRRILAAGALLIPALTFLACNDTTNQNPATPDTPSLGSPSTPATSSARPSPATDHLLRLRPSSAADLASVTVTALGPLAAHDPSIPGMRIQCQDGIPPGTSDPFKAPRDHGCELNTLAGGSAIAAPFQNLTRGRLVRRTTRLEFFYAGGPQNGGAPRFSLFTDFCRDATGAPVTVPWTVACTTDGTWDETLFIDQSNCNDGDVYVGAVYLKSTTAKTDATCPVFETYGPDGFPFTADEHVHPNWADYVAVHNYDRFALNTGDLEGDDQDFLRLDNFIIADVPVHYLVYHINMRATN